MSACFNGNIKVVKILLSNGACIHDENENGSTCFNLALSLLFSPFFQRSFDADKILYILRKWPMTMAILVLNELGLYHHIDCSSLIDLFQYLGKEDSTLDNS